MNKVEKTTISMGEMATGVELTVPVYSFSGTGDGPSVYIQANMHGAEVQGNAVIYQLLEKLSELTLASNITLVPYANPIGSNHKNGEYTLGRFDPITGVNWNRMYHFDDSDYDAFVINRLSHPIEQIEEEFKALLIAQINEKLDHNQFGLTTGERIAYQLQRMAHNADLVLDLHTGPISSKHLYCPEYAKKSASYFNIPHTILIPNEFAGAMDEASFCPWWTLTEKFAQHGRTVQFNKEGFTVELGSQECIDLDEAKIDAESILSYLSFKEAFVSSEFKPKDMIRYACWLDDYKRYFSPMGGMVDYLAEFGKPLPAGQPLARILRMDNYGDGEALHYLALDMEVLPILHFASASVNQGTELYKVFQNYFILDD